MSRGPRELTERLASRLGRETVVVGVGNPMRGDDVAGCLVTQALREGEAVRGSLGMRIVEAEDVPESFLGPIVDPPPDTVILVDAVELGESPGAVALLEVHQIEGRESSTHRPPLSLVAQYIEGATGADVFLLGIQPGDRGMGRAPSVEIRESARFLAEVLETAAVLADLPEGSIPAFRKASPEVPC